MKRTLYTRAWKILENASPLAGDCGNLCDRACCGGTSDDGMLLFPGEEAMYDQNEDWFEIRDSHILLPDGSPVKLFVCKGSCPREMRPLSCRIFPLLPYIDDLDYLEFVPDLRGLRTCPLLFESVGESISPDFIDALHSAFSTLIGDKRVLDFIEMLSGQYDEMLKDIRRFL